jgi:hypothetical protein
MKLVPNLKFGFSCDSFRKKERCPNAIGNRLGRIITRGEY